MPDPSHGRVARTQGGGLARFVLFFGLTMVFAVPFLVLGAVVRAPTDAGVDLPVAALQFIAPFLAAMTLVVRDGGWRAAGKLLVAAFDLRRIRSWRRVVPLILLVPAIYVASFGLMRLGGRPVPDPEFALPTIVVLLVLFIISAYAEEVGWTGYALEPLRRRVGWLGAALIIGVAWAAFHVPADLQAGREVEWIVWHRIASVALRVLIVGAYLVAGQAIAAAVLVHAADSISWATFPIGGSHYDPWVTAPILVLVVGALTLAWTWRRRRRTRSANPRPADG